MPSRRQATDGQVQQMASRPTAGSIEEYIAGFPLEVQQALQEVRAVIKASAPGAAETMSYAIPTFDMDGRHLVHFAGYEQHVGFYPGPSGIAAFTEELKPYKSAKGSVRFPLDRPMPAHLIRRIVEFRVRESAGAAAPPAPLRAAPERVESLRARGGDDEERA